MTIKAKRHAKATDMVELWEGETLYGMVHIDLFWRRDDPDSKPVYDRLRMGGSVDLVLSQSVLFHEVAA